VLHKLFVSSPQDKQRNHRNEKEQMKTIASTTL
jgi:hypothetical protein